MSKVKIYHNPRCSKSRDTLKLIQDNGFAPEVIEYLKTPPSAAELAELGKMLGAKAKDFLRTKEAVFATLKLNLDDDIQIYKAMHQNPELIERPIVVKDKKAVLGRPPENVLALLK